MLQNSCFEDYVGMEIENQLGTRGQSKEYFGNKRINLFQTPRKQDYLGPENQMDESQQSPHFILQCKNQRESTQYNYNSENENTANENKDEFQIDINFTPKTNECLFTELNNLIVQVQEKIQNLSQQSPGANDLSQCYGTYSEIKQQIYEIERVYRTKDDELSQLNIQLEKEFNSCKNQKYLDLTTNIQVNQSFDISKRYQQLQEIKKTKLQKFKNKYHEKYRLLKSDLDELKSTVKQFLSKNSFTLDNEQCYLEFSKMFNAKFKEEISFGENSNQDIENQKSESPKLKDNQCIDSFILTLMKEFDINEGDVENIRVQILQCVINQKELILQQKNQLETIQTNQNLSANQQINKLKKIKDELENELIQLNLQKEQQQKVLDQSNRGIQELKQKLERIENMDYTLLNSRLLQQEQIQMKQQQKLISIASIIFQQLIESVSYKSQIKIMLQEYFQHLNTYFDKANEIINKQNWKQDDDPLKYFNYHQQTVQKMMDIICAEYSKMIRVIQQQRQDLMSQL
ncbi:unnamed protein product (macronuclear) [Paramecium tetraurelia]|uniref:Uncharacterized protein n=1 Tax=Paramecium tetraurelia TaxID=5888 RepID=A0BCS2_PARTE|nr:uncharacterized protein GSPATT00004433001 [Paramecium tetraurelia]CAK56339.1 unnamed protein product [Paramecium tetraurelia]|eukprot:XP_001423737.1 hypothetical protein (macronuclear) [Paramecium tetraurelia strain d4-2]